MTDATLRIKNLSIALEALSRIALGDGRYNHFARIEELLDDAIKEAQKEIQWPHRARPASTPPNLEDEIPF